MDTQTLGLERSEWRFTLKWVLSSVGGWLGAGIVLAVGATIVLETVGPPLLRPLLRSTSTAAAQSATVAMVGMLLIGAGGGAVRGAVQWLVLRRRVHRSGWWILASALGWAMGGVLSSAAQWLMLRRRVQRSGWWVLASTVGWVVGLIVFAVLNVVMGLVASMITSATMGIVRSGAWFALAVVVTGGAQVLALVMGSTVYGTVTGYVLALLLRHPIEERREADA